MWKGEILGVNVAGGATLEDAIIAVLTPGGEFGVQVPVRVWRIMGVFDVDVTGGTEESTGKSASR